MILKVLKFSNLCIFKKFAIFDVPITGNFVLLAYLSGLNVKFSVVGRIRL